MTSRPKNISGQASLEDFSCSELIVVSKRVLASWVARTDFFPFSAIYAHIYRLGMAFLVFRLRRLAAVLGVYLSGSQASGDCLHGVSDVDFFVAVDSRYAGETQTAAALERALTGAIGRFPFLGPLSERRQAIVAVDRSGAFDHSHLSYRMKRAGFRPLYERPGFSLKQSSRLGAPEVVSEISVQIKGAIAAMAAGRDHLYFWKSKLRALIVLITNSATPGPHLASLNLDEPGRAFLENLWRQRNHRLFSDSCPERRGAAYAVFWQLVDQATREYGLNDLPVRSLEFCRLSARLPMVREVVVRDGVVSFRAPELLHWPFAGVAVTDETPDRLTILEAKSWKYGELLAAMNAAGETPYGSMLVYHGDFVVAVDDDCRATSIYETPFAFQAGFAGKSLRFVEAFLQPLLARAKAARQETSACRTSLFPDADQAKEGATATPALATARYFVQAQSDLELLRRVIEGYRLGCVGEEKITLFSAATDALADIERAYPEHRQFLRHFTDYYLALTSGQEAGALERLPSNFFGYLIRFFAAVAEGGPLPEPRSLNHKLTLSLCVLTKDRGESLEHLLDSVVGQRRSPDQVVVVDNGATTLSQSIVERFAGRLPLVYVRDDAGSIPRLRNRAIKESVGEIVCFTDDDCVLDENWLANVERSFLRSTTIGAVGGAVKHIDGKPDSAVNRFNELYLGSTLKC